MTLHVDLPHALKVGNASIGHLRACLAAMLENGPEARLIATRTADVLGSNEAGAALTPAFQSLDAAVRSAVTAWLVTPQAKDLEIRLPIEGKLASYVLHKVPLELDDSNALYLVIARQPNLSGHLIQALSQSRALYKDIAESVPGIIWETRGDGRFSFVGGQHIPGLDQNTLAQEAPAHALGIPADMAEMIFLSAEPVQSVDVWVSTDDGERRCLCVSAKPVLSKAGAWVGARGIALDVTAERLDSDAVDAASRTIMNKAETDALTGLLNRRGFEDRLGKICRQVRSADAGGYLALIDLDKFKQLNDTHGHKAGDAALKEVATLLKHHIRREDIVGRLGGDEFVVWIDDARAEGMHRVCQSLLSDMPEVCDMIDLPGFGLGMSIGITRFRPGQDTLQSLMERADKTMYCVKASGRGTYRFDGEGADA